MVTFSTFGLSNKAWNHIKHLFKKRNVGRPRKYPLRNIFDAILYVAKTGCQWNLLPTSFPPWKLVYNYFRSWSNSGIIEATNDLLRSAVRILVGKNSRPTIVIIDSESVKSTSLAKSKGFDGNKKVKGKKRHLMVDSLGFIIAVLLLRANLHDIKGGKCLVARLRDSGDMAKLKEIHADKAYQGLKCPDPVKLIISSVSGLKEFVPIVHRWKVERTIAWLGGYRRLSKDFERKNFYGESWVYVASIMMLDRRLKSLG